MTRAYNTATTQQNSGGAVGGFVAGKNALINGDFRINQRSFTSRTTEGYGFDRWRSTINGGTVTYSAQTFTPGTAPVAGYEGINFARMLTESQSAFNHYAILTQPIEDVRTDAGQTVTVSFWAKAASGTPKIALEFVQNFGSGGSADVNTYAGQVTISTSWARYSITGTIPSVSGKTIGASSSIAPYLWSSAGSNFNSRAGSIGLQNNTIDYWGIQMESGSVATPFQTATGTIQGELAACQYYFNRLAGETTFHQISNGQCWSSTEAMATVNYPIMRIAPTVTYSTASFFSLQNATNTEVAITALASYNIRRNSYKPNMTVASGLVAGNATLFQTRSTGTVGTLDLSAEL